MFLYQQDIAMLHGAVLSAQKTAVVSEDHVPSTEPTKSELNEVDVVKNVHRSLLVASHLYKSCKHQTYSQRMHAVLFYTTLRSNGIVCDAGDEYYQCVMNIFPAFDWRLYIEVNKACHWSHHYIQCVIQLPDEIAATVLENTCKEISNEGGDSDLSILHSVLQCLIRKLFGSDKADVNKIPEYSFAFDFSKKRQIDQESISNCDKVENVNSEVIHSPIKKCETVSFFEVLEHSLKVIGETNRKITVANVVLRGFVTLFDLLLSSEEHRIGFMTSKEMERYVFFSKDFLLDEAMYEPLKTMLLKYNLRDFQASKAAGISSEMEVGYTLFLAYYKWAELSSIFEKESSINVSLRTDIFDALTQMFEILFSFHPLKMKEIGPIFENYIGMLISLINDRAEGMNYAVEIFLQDSLLMERNDVRSCLVENKSILAGHISHLVMLMDMLMMRSTNGNDPLYKIFFQLFNEMPSAQHEILQHFLAKYGLTTNLKSEQFETKLASFLSRSVKLNQTKNTIVDLCLQSAKETVERTVERAIDTGIVGIIEVLVQGLKSVSCVCAYETALGEPKLLVSILAQVFPVRKLTHLRLQNIPILIQGLLQVFDDCILSRYDLLSACILANMDNGAPDLIIKFYFQMFNIILNDIVESGKVLCLKDLDMPALIVYLCKVINVCTITFNGQLKEIVVAIMNTLVQVQDKLNMNSRDVEANQKWIQKSLSAMDPTVQFYAWSFIQETDINISSLPLTHLLSWYCFKKEKDVSILKEQILQNAASTQHGLLVASLTQLLPHFTTNEFLHLSLILEECLATPFANENLESFVETCTTLKLSDRCRKVTEVTKLLMDAFFLLKKCKDLELNWSYMMSCLLQIIQNQLKTFEADFRLSTCVGIFCEVCKLSEAFADEDDQFGGVLLELSTELKKEMNDPEQNRIICKFLSAVVQNLQDVDIKTNIMKVLQ